MKPYETQELTFRSSDGKHRIYACYFLPKGNIRAVVQIVHGMNDNIHRYKRLISYLTAHGIAVCGNDHLGHGKTACTPEERGFFASENGWLYVLKDVRRMTLLVRRRFPRLPVFLLGHSMGSMLARLYVTRFANDLAGLICLGTTGTQKLVGVGEAFAACTAKVQGDHAKKTLIPFLAFHNYCSHFPKEEGPLAWISRDIAMLAERAADDDGDFGFSAAAYRDMFHMVSLISSKKWYEAYPTDLPTLLASGMEDALGNYGKGVREVSDKLRARGVCDLCCYLYPHMRHELHNDPDSELFFSDVYEWIEVVLCS